MSLQHTQSVSSQAQCSLTCVVALCGQMIMYNGQPIAQSPKANVRTEHPKKAYLSVHDTKQYTKVVTLGEVDSLPASNMKLDDQVPLIRGQAKAAAGATALQLPEKCTLRSVPNLLDNSASFMVTGATRQQVHRLRMLCVQQTKVVIESVLFARAVHSACSMENMVSRLRSLSVNLAPEELQEADPGRDYVPLVMKLAKAAGPEPVIMASGTENFGGLPPLGLLRIQKKCADPNTPTLVTAADIRWSWPSVWKDRPAVAPGWQSSRLFRIRSDLDAFLVVIRGRSALAPFSAASRATIRPHFCPSLPSRVTVNQALRWQAVCPQDVFRVYDRQAPVPFRVGEHVGDTNKLASSHATSRPRRRGYIVLETEDEKREQVACQGHDRGRYELQVNSDLCTDCGYCRLPCPEVDLENVLTVTSLGCTTPQAVVQKAVKQTLHPK
jgi:NAD-dependent dihydropyrimidine dehydrogenase PreA subunit